MVGWHHRFNGDEFGQTLGEGKGQGRLVCCSPWGHEELDTTWQLNNNIDMYQEYNSSVLGVDIAGFYLIHFLNFREE